jgi:hypothetical protein
MKAQCEELSLNVANRGNRFQLKELNYEESLLLTIDYMFHRVGCVMMGRSLYHQKDRLSDF